MLGREAGLAEGGEEGVTRSSHVHLPTQPDECLVGTKDHRGGMLIDTGERCNGHHSYSGMGEIQVISFRRGKDRIEHSHFSI